MDVSASREGCLALQAGARSPGLCLGTHRRGALSSHLPLVSPQRLVVEQAARGSSPPDLRLQYLHQMQANHEVRPFWGPCPEPSTQCDPPLGSHTQAPACRPAWWSLPVCSAHSQVLAPVAGAR